MRSQFLAVALVCAAGCALDDGRPPVARIAVDPGAVPEHDDFRTDITLDATLSADPIDDPEGATELSVQWEIVGDEHRFESGSDTSPMAVIRVRGDTPATIRLTVTDVDGLSAMAATQLRLTVR